MSNVTISDAIRYIGVDDKDIDLFESQYIVPNGVSYNSYVILDEKIVVMDTVDARKTDEWLEKLERELDGKTPDYLVISHLEPDHSGSIQAIAEKYPQMQFVSNAKVFAMLPQFFEMDVTDKKVVVAEGDTLSLGAHTLTFVMAPMVHWPEVMVSYESTEKVLFSADAFCQKHNGDIVYAVALRRYGRLGYNRQKDAAGIFRKSCLRYRNVLYIFAFGKDIQT